jgi:hypothetical protein
MASFAPHAIPQLSSALMCCLHGIYCPAYIDHIAKQQSADVESPLLAASTAGTRRKKEQATQLGSGFHVITQMCL